MKSGVTRRVKTLIASEIARWKCWVPPFGCTTAEVEAFQARREEYGTRLGTALTIIQADEDDMMSALGSVLANERESQSFKDGMPDVGSLVRGVRAKLRKDDAEATGKVRPPCVDCERDGGCPLNADEYGPIETAHFVRGVGGHTGDPLCATHNDVRNYGLLLRAFQTGQMVRVGDGDPFHVRNEPVAPRALLPARPTPRGCPDLHDFLNDPTQGRLIR